MSNQIKRCKDCLKKITPVSTRCKSCSKKGILNNFYGKHHTKKAIKLISGENHYNWRYGKVKYKTVHQWVCKQKGPAKKCIECNKTRKTTRIEWANINHLYKRKLDDYIPLCCKCHYRYDKKNKLPSNKNSLS